MKHLLALLLALACWPAAAQTKYALTVTPPTGGTITGPNCASGSYNAGTGIGKRMASPLAGFTFSPTNATAAAITVLAYISSVTTNAVTITHVATTASTGTVSIVCTKN